MQILVLNRNIEHDMLEFCSQALYNHTIDRFAEYGWVINDDRFELTSPNLQGVTVQSIWVVDRFILDNNIPLLDRINLLMTYLECNGCILWGRENYSGRYFVPFLQRLVSEHIISEEINVQIFGLWTEFRNGRTDRPHFDMTDM